MTWQQRHNLMHHVCVIHTLTPLCVLMKRNPELSKRKQSEDHHTDQLRLRPGGANTMNTFVQETQWAESEAHLPLTQWGLSSAVQRPASLLLASGCAARSSRWTSWGWSHLCSGSRTSCGPHFYNFSQLLGKSGRRCSESIFQSLSVSVAVHPSAF